MSTVKVTNIQHGSATNVAMVLDSAGTVKAYSTIGVGNTTPSTSGAGITFPATASASSDANTLDDYEEGTWTPVLTDLTNNATMTSTVGRYIKIGRSVTLQGQVSTSSLGSVTGDTYISGLPFVAESTAGNYAGVTVGTGGDLAITAGQSVSMLTDPNTSYLQLFLWDSAAGSTRLQASEWSSDGQIRFSITYFTSN